MASTWIADLTGQRLYDSGIEVQPTVKEWNIKGADIAYNPLTKRVDIEVGDGVASDYKQSCRVASTASLVATRVNNILTANANGLLNTAGIDGVTNLALADRVLLKDQATGQDNGIYQVTDLGSASTPWVMERASAANEQGEVTSGMTTYVSEGTANGLKRFVLTSTDPITLNVSPLVFTEDPVGGAAPIGPASGDLSGSYPSPSVAKLTETSGPTSLTIGSIADTEILVRSGATIVGQVGASPSGSAGGDLSGSYPNPAVAAVTSGGTQLTVGAISDGQPVMRSGTSIIGAPLVTVSPVGTTFTPDATLGSVFELTMTGGADTLANPTGLVEGCSYCFVIQQHGAGPGTLSYGTDFLWPGGTPHVVTAVAGAVDIVSAIYRGAKLLAVGNANFS